MTVKLLTEHNLEFLSLTGGCRGSSESTLVKMPHCCKLHVVAQYAIVFLLQECDKKEADYANKATELRKKYESSCKQLGIKVI